MIVAMRVNETAHIGMLRPATKNFSAVFWPRETYAPIPPMTTKYTATIARSMLEIFTGRGVETLWPPQSPWHRPLGVPAPNFRHFRHAASDDVHARGELLQDILGPGIIQDVQVCCLR